MNLNVQVCNLQEKVALRTAVRVQVSFPMCQHSASSGRQQAEWPGAASAQIIWHLETAGCSFPHLLVVIVRTFLLRNVCFVPCRCGEHLLITNTATERKQLHAQTWLLQQVVLQPSPVPLLHHNVVYTDEELQLWREYKTGSRLTRWLVNQPGRGPKLLTR